MIDLRPYQVEAVEALREGLRAGHRSQVMYLPTGGGKSVVAAHLMAEANRKGSRATFLADRTVLVDQFSAHLDSFSVPHGVIMAKHWRWRPYERIQVASAQTIERRVFIEGTDLLVVDECHIVRKQTADLIRNVPGLRVLGLTATPFTKGLSELYSHVVSVRTTNELISEGALVPLKMYAAIAPDMDGAKVVAGEWSERDIEKRGLAIVGDIVAEWVAKTALHFGGPVKTFVFSATVDHGAELCRQFNEAGYRFEQISYRDANDERRRELMAEFRKPDSKILGLVSCEALSRGTDVPDVLCGIGARPYRKSISSHVQQIGRVMRPSPGKDFGLWLDHSGNCLRFHEDTERLFGHGVQSLDDADLDARTRKEPTQEEVRARKCGACGFMLPAGADACPACGHERPRRPEVEVIGGTMVMVGGKQPDAKRQFLADKGAVWSQLVWIAREKKPLDHEGARRWAQANYRDIYGDFALRTFETASAAEPSPELRNLLRSKAIRWARGHEVRA